MDLFGIASHSALTRASKVGNYSRNLLTALLTSFRQCIMQVEMSMRAIWLFGGVNKQARWGASIRSSLDIDFSSVTCWINVWNCSNAEGIIKKRKKKKWIVLSNQIDATHFNSILHTPTNTKKQIDKLLMTSEVTLLLIQFDSIKSSLRAVLEQF